MEDNENNLAFLTQDLKECMDIFYSDDIMANQLKLLNINSKYYDIESIPQSIPTNSQFRYKTVHLNIRSLPDKHSKLKLFVQRLKDSHLSVDFILLCETFLTAINSNMYQIPGYKFIHKSRSQSTRGGVAMYIREDIQFKLRDDLSLFNENEFESIFIEVTQNQKSTIVGEIYRIPSSNETSSLCRYETITGKLQNLNKDVII